MQNTFYRIFICWAILLAGFLTFSCSKSEGEGGTSIITGKVVIREYDKYDPEKFEEYVAMEKRIYIVYGDELVQGDEMRTSKDGYYSFKYLKKGKYQVYGYSECEDCDEGIVPKVVEVEISKNRTEYFAPEIVLNKY